MTYLELNLGSGFIYLTNRIFSSNQSNELDHDGAIYLDRILLCVFLNEDKLEWKQAKIKWE